MGARVEAKIESDRQEREEDQDVSEEKLGQPHEDNRGKERRSSRGGVVGVGCVGGGEGREGWEER